MPKTAYNGENLPPKSKTSMTVISPGEKGLRLRILRMKRAILVIIAGSHQRLASVSCGARLNKQGDP